MPLGSSSLHGLSRSLLDAVGQAAWSTGHIPGLRMETCWADHLIGLGGD